jgi:hypothetical protein
MDLEENGSGTILAFLWKAWMTTKAASIAGASAKI